MTNEFWYWFSMILIIAASIGLGVLVGYVIGLNRGVQMMTEDLDTESSDTREVY